ncbi:MAG: hypothetical protein EBZ40_09225 [Gammaproteobacteria bacterium]|nr:hypothetical protein [Gammaproteobacteria bacterium]
MAYCVAYALVFVLDAPIFLYYPLEGVFAWAWSPYASAGPAMAWYGLVVAAAAIALPAACLVPQRLIIARRGIFLWFTPLAVLAICAWRLRFFFA